MQRSHHYFLSICVDNSYSQNTDLKTTKKNLPARCPWTKSNHVRVFGGNVFI